MTMADATAPTDPGDLPIEQARQNWLAKQSDKTEQTQGAYDRRTRLFVEWCDENGIETVGELTPFLVDQFDLWIRDRYDSMPTIRGRLQTNRQLLDYFEQIGATDHDLAAAIDVPVLNRQEAKSEKRLDPEEATRLLRHFRSDPATFGTPEHAFLELAWYTGARLGAIRGLDLDDYEPDEQRIHFRHQPETGTPLKNKHEGERYVGISTEVVEALNAYIQRERWDKRDDHGRQPLLSGRQGRPSVSTLRAWSYMATQPCRYGPCPHGEDYPTCKYRERNYSSQCPSSRSPHHIRTGSITWQLNRGLPVETVARRVNATARIIREFYDAADDLEEFEHRRKDAAAALSIDNETPDQSDHKEDETNE